MTTHEILNVRASLEYIQVATQNHERLKGLLHRAGRQLERNELTLLQDAKPGAAASRSIAEEIAKVLEKLSQ